MTAALLTFPEPPRNGLTRGQVRYLREHAASCRDTAVKAANMLSDQADHCERIASAPIVTEADWQYIYRHIGTVNHPYFDSLK